MPDDLVDAVAAEKAKTETMYSPLSNNFSIRDEDYDVLLSSEEADTFESWVQQ
jgi:hypothetical protein